MSFQVFSFARYLTRVENLHWRREDYHSQAMINLLKGEDFSGYVDKRIDGKMRRLKAGDSKLATKWFAEVVGSITFSTGSTYYLCPIPDSQCTSGCGRPPKILPAVHEIAKRYQQFKTWDGLRFVEATPPGAQRNPCDVRLLFNSLEIVLPVPPRAYVIFVDDLFSSGARFMAAQARLKCAGATSFACLAAARTANDQLQAGFGLVEDQLEDFQP